MNNRAWTTHPAVKAVAFLLAVLLWLASVLGLCGSAYIFALREPIDPVDAPAGRLTARLVNRLTGFYDYEVAAACFEGESPKKWAQKGIFCTVTDEAGEVLYSDYGQEDYLLRLESSYWFSSGEGSVYEGEIYAGKEPTCIRVVRYVTADALDSTTQAVLAFATGWDSQLKQAVLGGGLCLLLAVGVTVFLLTVAGRGADRGAPRCRGLHRLPFDVYAGLFLGGIWLLILFLDELRYSAVSLWVLICLCGCLVVGVCLLLGFAVGFAVRVKTHTLWRNTLIACLWRGLRAVVTALPLAWKTALLCAALTLVELFFVAMGGGLVFLTLERVVTVPLAVLFAGGLSRLQKAIDSIAAGNYACRVNTSYMTGEQRHTAQALAHIQDGLSTAVEGRLKSERFKTELITNVSHDIKTPLTSIISYVDLLEKEQPEGERVQEYIEVLQRQSARLKKLIEDLTEASKASTGNLPVHPTPCDLCVLLEQTVGEYTEKAEKANLDVQLALPEEPLTVMADGRHLWRVLDNLMNNICKYAQPGTRVYLELVRTVECARITFRNISASPLNITSEELMERFVRGDSSRNTEGSGLGLSIARSLTELQGGQLLLAVDGDLFKVILLLPLPKEGET